MARFDLTDEEWAIISPLLPKQERGPERRDDRRVLNGIFYTPTLCTTDWTSARNGAVVSVRLEFGPRLGGSADIASA